MAYTQHKGQFQAIIIYSKYGALEHLKEKADQLGVNVERTMHLSLALSSETAELFGWKVVIESLFLNILMIRIMAIILNINIIYQYYINYHH